MALVPESVLTARTTFQKSVAILKPMLDRVEPRFLYFALQADLRRLIEFAGGTAQKNLLLRDLRAFEVRLPPLPIQRRIASILGAYDDLIEVNRRRIAVLEEMARRLFDEWFVHFRFPGHEGHRMVETEHGRLPEGWCFVSLYDIADVGFGFPFKSRGFTSERQGAGVIRIRDILDGSTETFTEEPFDDRYAVKDGDVLVGMDGFFHMAVWSGGDAALNQRVTRLRPLNGRSPMWLFLSIYAKIKHLEATITGTTVDHLSARDLKAIRLVLPPDQLLTKADALLAECGAALLTYRGHQQRLAASRNLLLPRLISGELSVTEAERELDAAE